jgi:diadenosine tetraphosphate (Ap4A) HIT family hydrolase
MTDDRPVDPPPPMASAVSGSPPPDREWSAEWFELRRGVGWPMCAEGRPEDNGYGVRFHSETVSDTYLQRAAIQRGYSVVIWRGRHVAEPTELSRGDAISYWVDVLDATSAIEKHFEPIKVNLWMAGNGLPHLHTHVIPRFRDDRAPEGPLAYPDVLPDAFPEEPFVSDAPALRRLTGHP